MVPTDADDATSKRRRLKRRLVALAILLVAGLVAWPIVSYLLEQPLKEAIAEADRLDPGWRWDDLQARLPTVPDHENALVHVLDVNSLLPRGWSARLDGFTGLKPANVRYAYESDLACPMRLPPALATIYQTDLAALAKPLAEARKLASLTRGRLPSSSEWRSSPAVLATRDVHALLLHDAIWQAELGQASNALLDLRAALRLDHSIGEEPHYSAQCTRLILDVKAMEVLERVLAQVNASDQELAALQEVLEETTSDSILLTVMRGGRAQLYEHGDEIAGNLRTITSGPLPLVFNERQLGLLLGLMNQAVEQAKLPPGEQFQAFVQMENESRPVVRAKVSPLTSAHVHVGRPIVQHAARHYFRRQATCATALVAIAAERFRLKYGRWPERLDELAPLLKRMPVDPYDGKPLRFKLQPDGLIVYSVSWDRQDAGGVLKRDNPAGDGADSGFQLWDVPARRQPAKLQATQN
jgi:hypothetical protein